MLIDEDGLWCASLARSNGMTISSALISFFIIDAEAFAPVYAEEISVFKFESLCEAASTSSIVAYSLIDDLTLLRVSTFTPSEFFLQQLFLPHLVMMAHIMMLTPAIPRIGKMTPLLIKDSSSFSENSASSFASAVSRFYTLICKLEWAWLDAICLNQKSFSASAAWLCYWLAMYFMYWSTMSCVMTKPSGMTMPAGSSKSSGISTPGGRTTLLGNFAAYVCWKIFSKPVANTSLIFILMSPWSNNCL